MDSFVGKQNCKHLSTPIFFNRTDTIVVAKVSVGLINSKVTSILDSFCSKHGLCTISTRFLWKQYKMDTFLSQICKISI